MSVGSALRSATGTETIEERHRRLFTTFVDLGKFLADYDTGLGREPEISQQVHRVEEVAAEASRELCRDVVVPPLTDVQVGTRDGAMLQYAAECNARRRFDVLLFVPNV